MYAVSQRPKLSPLDRPEIGHSAPNPKDEQRPPSNRHANGPSGMTKKMRAIAAPPFNASSTFIPSRAYLFPSAQCHSGSGEVIRLSASGGDARLRSRPLIV